MGNPKRICLMGDSAGGHLIAAHCISATKAAAHSTSPVPALPGCIVLISPWVDPLGGVNDGPDTLDTVTGYFHSTLHDAMQGEKTFMDVVPHASEAELSGFPPTLITVGGCEALRDSISVFYNKLRAANPDGVVMMGVAPEQIHIYQIYFDFSARNAPANTIWGKKKRFLAKHIGG